MCPLSAETLIQETIKNDLGISAQAMGGAYSSVFDSRYALFYNPAGLSRQQTQYHSEDLDFSEYKLGKHKSTLFGVGPLAYGQWEKQVDATNQVQVTAYGFGKANNNGVHWGLTYKDITAEIEGVSQKGWSTDFGFLLYVLPGLNMSFVLHDLLNESVALSPSVRSGIALRTEDKRWLLASDLVYDFSPNEHTLAPSLGIGCQISSDFRLHAGINSSAFSGGFTWALPLLYFNYAAKVTSVTQSTQHLFGFGISLPFFSEPIHRRDHVVPTNAFAKLTLSDTLIEGASEMSVFGGARLGTNDILSAIHEIGDDPTCYGLILTIQSLPSDLSSIAVVQEIRHELKRLKDKGKRVIVYIDYWATLSEYYLASVADRIVMPELGGISHLGIKAEIIKVKSFLSKFGIETDIIASGEHKGSLSPNSDHLSDSQEQMVETLIQDLYHQALFDIKHDRSMDWALVGQYFDGRMISVSEAKSLGFVDAIGYWDTVEEMSKELLNTSIVPEILPISEFLIGPAPPTLFSFKPKIAVIEIDGVMTLRKQGNRFLYGDKEAVAEDIEDIVENIVDDPSIKGVLLRVNSPGGSMIASDRIYTAMGKLQESGKIVYASMGNMTTSGGYYITLRADQIYANPGTLTGSIGVISEYKNQQRLNDILGIDVATIKTGEYMDMFSTNKPLTKDEKALLIQFQNDQYEHFKEKVKEHRHMTMEETHDVAQGQILTGEQAKKLHLVDHIGNYLDAMNDLSSTLNITAKPEVRYYRKQPRPNFQQKNRGLLEGFLRQFL